MSMGSPLGFAAGARGLFARLCLLAWVLFATYGVAQPSCQGLFLSTYGSRGLPWAWLGVTVLSVVTAMWAARRAAEAPLWRVLRRAALSGVPRSVRAARCSAAA